MQVQIDRITQRLARGLYDPVQLRSQQAGFVAEIERRRAVNTCSLDWSFAAVAPGNRHPCNALDVWMQYRASWEAARLARHRHLVQPDTGGTQDKACANTAEEAADLDTSDQPPVEVNPCVVSAMPSERLRCSAAPTQYRGSCIMAMQTQSCLPLPPNHVEPLLGPGCRDGRG